MIGGELLGSMRQVTGVNSTVSEVPCVKRIGFLSFGQWTPAHHSEVRAAAGALVLPEGLALSKSVQQRGVTVVDRPDRHDLEPTVCRSDRAVAPVNIASFRSTPK